MRKNRVWLHSVLLATLLAALMTACGGSSVDDAPPPPAQTGDTSLFANAGLLSTATTLDTSGVIILDARSVDLYNAGHIPGAISAPPSTFTEAGKENVLLAATALKTILGGMGIQKDSKIVIYDDTTASLGAGGRLFWMLEYLGCTDVSLLNGGWDQWVAQNRAVSVIATPPLAPVDFEAIDSGVDEAISVDSVQVKAIVDAAASPVLLVDARTFDEYRGFDQDNVAVMIETTRPGHIPGAVNLPYTECYNADKSVKNAIELKQLFDAKGITADKSIIVYSTVGKRSAFIYYLTRLMGYTQVANYCGSAQEWANLGLVPPATVDDYPLVTGAAP